MRPIPAYPAKFGRGSKTTLLLVTLALAGFAAVIILPALGFLKAIILLLALLAAVNAVFSPLTVVITDSGLEFWFGMESGTQKSRLQRFQDLLL